jgi:multimeric flavodoxin WrbA
MKVLGIAASPRRNGNSERLLDRMLEGACSKGARTEKIILNELNIRPYQAGPIKDDMRPLYKKLKQADAIIVASPIYFGSVTAQLKIFIDRCQPIWIESLALKKKRLRRKKRKGVFIAVSSYDRGRFFKNAEQIVKIFFLVLGIDLFKRLYVANVESKADILKHRDIFDKAFRYGASLINAIKKNNN